MARWNSCNVLQAGAGVRQIWHFDARNNGFNLSREQTVRAGEPLPEALVRKSWNTLWQPKLNLAWLPAEHVFIRVAHLPASSPEETRAMVELQLEKLSPMPVTQVVWSMHVLPPAEGAAQSGPEATAMQTVVITIVARNVVEEFLGQLEGQGYLVDGVEFPLLDQLQATRVTEDGAWIYPGLQSSGKSALVAWWCGGVLQTVDLLMPSAGTDQAASVRDQLLQMAWAGELEGWLSSLPRWHLVADEGVAREWLAWLQQGLELPVEVVPPLAPQELAARTARRAALANPKDSLLPAEFAARYRQQFVDRLWLRGLGATLALYVVGVIIYFVAVTFLSYRTTAVEAQVSNLGGSYTNVMRLKAQYQVLKDRQELKYAALDCWEAVAETLPENVTLNSMNFNDGQKLMLAGSAPASEALSVNDFRGKLAKATVRGGQPLFDPDQGSQLQQRQDPSGATINWSFSLVLKQTER